MKIFVDSNSKTFFDGISFKGIDFVSSENEANFFIKHTFVEKSGLAFIKKMLIRQYTSERLKE